MDQIILQPTTFVYFFLKSSLWEKKLAEQPARNQKALLLVTMIRNTW